MTSVPTIEDYKRLEESLGDLAIAVNHIKLALGIPMTVKVADIARMEGISRSQIVGKEAYLLPNFGVSQYPDGVKRWDLDTYLDWRKIPVERRKEAYATYLDAQRKKAVQSLLLA